MKPTVFLSLVLTVGLTGDAQAANFAVITAPPTILNLLVLVLGVAGVAIGFQVLNVLKGGYLSRAWQIFIAGFAVLVLGQISVLLPTFEIVNLPNWVAPGLTVVWVGTLFYGVFETKRVLA
jgi:hypothetical protein